MMDPLAPSHAFTRAGFYCFTAAVFVAGVAIGILATIASLAVAS